METAAPKCSSLTEPLNGDTPRFNLSLPTNPVGLNCVSYLAPCGSTTAPSSYLGKTAPELVTRQPPHGPLIAAIPAEGEKGYAPRSQFGAGLRGPESCVGVLELGALESPVATISDAVTDPKHQDRAAAYTLFPRDLDKEPRKTLGVASRKLALSPNRRGIPRGKEAPVAGLELSRHALDAPDAMSDPMLFSDTASCRTGSITNSEAESTFSGSGTITESPSHSLILQASDPHPGMDYDLGSSGILSQVGSWDDSRSMAPAKARTWPQTSPSTAPSTAPGVAPTNTPSTAPSAASTIAPSTTSRKRSSRSRYGDDDDDDDDTEDLRKSPKRQDNTEPENQQRFACPFYRHDPFKYTGCLSYSLRRIKDVKQHIYRKHGPLRYHCATCGLKFNTSDELTMHSFKAECTLARVQSACLEGISEDGMELLKRRGNRKASQKDQWLYIWEAAFPSAQPPESVWIGNHLDETVALIRLTWERNQRSILAPILADNKALVPSPMADHDLETVVIKTMTQVLNRFKEESLPQLSQAASPNPSSPHTTTSSPESSSCALTYNRKDPSNQLLAEVPVPATFRGFGVIDDMVPQYHILEPDEDAYFAPYPQAYRDW